MNTKEHQNSAQEGRSDSKALLGGFFTEAKLAANTMEGEQEGRAYRGYCPKCKNNALKIIHRDHEVVAKACNRCGVLVVLKDTPGHDVGSA